MNTAADRAKLYESAQAFFEAGGRGVMKLSPAAALEVCRLAAGQGFVIARVEGGLWHAPGFEARLDCIWDGADPPLSKEAAEFNNSKAADFIRDESEVHSAFVLTAPPITGWRHRAQSHAV